MQRSPVTIRRLGQDDIETLRALNRLFGKAFADLESYGSEPPSKAYLTDLLGKEHIAIIVAKRDETVIGGLVAYEFEKFEKARREVYIYDLAVAKEHRRRGIATDLIAHLRALASERGVWVMSVQADYGDDPAIALYEKLGTREDVIHFDIAVDPAAG